MIRIGNYGPINTTEESYADGHKTGLGWDREYVPGGPFVLTITTRPSTDVDWQRYCEQSRINNEAWMRGWREGSGRLG